MGQELKKKKNLNPLRKNRLGKHKKTHTPCESRNSNPFEKKQTLKKFILKQNINPSKKNNREKKNL